MCLWKLTKKQTGSQSNTEDDTSETSIPNTEKFKLNILNEEIRILNETNSKFIEENQLLKFQANELDKKILNLQNKLNIQEKKISQNVIDQKEFEFLKLNLIYSSKCKRSAFKKGFKVGTPEYRECILKKGNKLND